MSSRWRFEGEAQIDELFFGDWIEFGLSDLIAYLAKWARFAELYPESDQENPSD